MYQLRELERRDLETINAWRNDPDLIALLGAPFRYINLDVDIKWYENYINNRGNTVRCAIVEEDRDEIIGLASLVSIDYINQSAVFHIMIGNRQDRKKGVGTFAVNAMLNHAFQNMNLQRVELTVLEDNEPARRLYEKCGFKYEGRKRRAKFKDGQFVDMLMYGILKGEYTKGGYYKYNGPFWCVDTMADCSEIDRIIKQCDNAFDNPVSERKIYPELLRKIHQKGILIYAYSWEILGYIAIYANDVERKTAYISLIAVRPKVQKHHIGKDLLYAGMETAIAHGMEFCELEVRKSNVQAIKFYQRNGFVFQKDKGESIYMQKRLTITKSI